MKKIIIILCLAVSMFYCANGDNGDNGANANVCIADSGNKCANPHRTEVSTSMENSRIETTYRTDNTKCYTKELSANLEFGCGEVFYRKDGTQEQSIFYHPDGVTKRADIFYYENGTTKQEIEYHPDGVTKATESFNRRVIPNSISRETTRRKKITYDTNGIVTLTEYYILYTGISAIKCTPPETKCVTTDPD